MPNPDSIKEMAYDQATETTHGQSKHCTFQNGFHEISGIHPCDQGDQKSGEPGDRRNE
jgi:hypothetical protein